MSELLTFITIAVKRESKFDQDPAIVFDSDVPPVIASVPDD